MEIDPYCQRQNCSALNVLFIGVQILVILLVVPPLGEGVQSHYTASRVCQRQLSFLVSFAHATMSYQLLLMLG